MRGFRGLIVPGERGRNHVKKKNGFMEGRGHDKVEEGRRAKRGDEARKAIAEGTACAGNDEGPFRWMRAAAKRLQLLPEDAEALQGGLRFAERYWNGRFAFANLAFRAPARDPVRPGADGG